MTLQVRLDGHSAHSSIPVNSDGIAVPFETPLFKGRLLVRIAGLPSTVPGQDDGAQEYFRGKKRLMQCAVQVLLILLYINSLLRILVPSCFSVVVSFFFIVNLELVLLFLAQYFFISYFI